MPQSSMPEWLTHLLSVLSGGVGIKAFDYWKDRKKQKQDAALAESKQRIDADIALQDVIDRRVKLILEDDEKTIVRLTTDVRESNERISAMEEYIGMLVEALRTAGVPVPKRPEIIKPK